MSCQSVDWQGAQLRPRLNCEVRKSIFQRWDLWKISSDRPSPPKITIKKQGRNYVINIKTTCLPQQSGTCLLYTSFYEQVKDDIELLNEAGNEFSEEAILAGELTPVFFGSALTNFGVQTFLETFLKFAPEPHGHKKTDGEIVDPYDKDFSGFVFKIQANMDQMCIRDRYHSALLW